MSIFRWIELADRWTPRCPKCKQKMDCRVNLGGICTNEQCECNGMSTYEIWFGKEKGEDHGS